MGHHVETSYGLQFRDSQELNPTLQSGSILPSSSPL